MVFILHFAFHFISPPGECESSLTSVKFDSLASLASVKIILFPPLICIQMLRHNQGCVASKEIKTMSRFLIKLLPSLVDSNTQDDVKQLIVQVVALVSIRIFFIISRPLLNHKRITRFGVLTE